MNTCERLFHITSPLCGEPPRDGRLVTKALFINFTIREIFTFAKVYFGPTESHSYFASVTAA